MESTKGNRFMATAPVTAPRTETAVVKYHSVGVFNASQTVKLISSSSSLFFAAASSLARGTGCRSGASPSGSMPYCSGLCRIRAATGSPMMKVAIAMTRKAQRQPWASISSLMGQTMNAPTLNPSHMRPKARPRLRRHQLATAVEMGMLNPRLVPNITPSRNEAMKVGRLGDMLTRNSPTPKMGTPMNIMVRGPNLSTR